MIKRILLTVLSIGLVLALQIWFNRVNQGRFTLHEGERPLMERVANPFDKVTAFNQRQIHAVTQNSLPLDSPKKALQYARKQMALEAFKKLEAQQRRLAGWRTRTRWREQDGGFWEVKIYGGKKNARWRWQMRLRRDGKVLHEDYGWQK